MRHIDRSIQTHTHQRNSILCRISMVFRGGNNGIDRTEPGDYVLLIVSASAVVHWIPPYIKVPKWFLLPISDYLIACSCRIF